MNGGAGDRGAADASARQPQTAEEVIAEQLVLRVGSLTPGHRHPIMLEQVAPDGLGGWRDGPHPVGWLERLSPHGVRVRLVRHRGRQDGQGAAGGAAPRRGAVGLLPACHPIERWWRDDGKGGCLMPVTVPKGNRQQRPTDPLPSMERSRGHMEGFLCSLRTAGRTGPGRTAERRHESSSNVSPGR